MAKRHIRQMTATDADGAWPAVSCPLAQVVGSGLRPYLFAPEPVALAGPEPVAQVEPELVVLAEQALVVLAEQALVVLAEQALVALNFAAQRLQGARHLWVSMLS